MNIGHISVGSIALYRGKPVRVISKRTYYNVVTADGSISYTADYDMEPAPPGYVVPCGDSVVNPRTADITKRRIF
jgi:hypothetical protein